MFYLICDIIIRLTKGSINYNRESSNLLKIIQPQIE